MLHNFQPGQPIDIVEAIMSDETVDEAMIAEWLQSTTFWSLTCSNKEWRRFAEALKQVQDKSEDLRDLSNRVNDAVAKMDEYEKNMSDHGA